MQHRTVGNFVVRRVAMSIVAATLVQSISACSDSNNTEPLVATNIATSAGSLAQTGVVGQALATPITVVVTDQNNAPLANAVVTWSVSSADGTLSTQSSTTDASGDASVVWTLGTSAGLDSLTASLPNGTTAVITATAAAGGVSALNIASGDAQVVAAGSTTLPLVVRAIDQFGNPVANANITWSAVGGGSLSATSGTTDASGQAQVTFTTDALPASYSVSASIGQNISVTFTVSGT